MRSHGGADAESTVSDRRTSSGTPVEPYPYDWHRILSGVLAVVWLTLCGALGGAGRFLQSLVPIGTAVACIWFADTLASFDATSGLITSRVLKAGPPAGLVRAFGWIALLVWTLGRPLAFLLLAPRRG